MIRNFTMKILICSLALLTIAGTSGCSDSIREDATGRSTIRGINAVVDSPDLTFLIEEVPIGDVIAFKSATIFDEYDDLSYNFNFDRVLAGFPRTREATQFIDVVADMEYTVVVGGSAANPTLSVWENETREFTDTDTVFEAEFIHHAPTQGALDVYFAPPGTTPVAGQATGTLNNGERISVQEFTGGDYELIVTPAGDANTILFQTSTIPGLMATRVTFAVFDPDPSVTTNIAVNLISPNGASGPLTDVTSLNRLRIFHAAFGTGDIDGFVNDDFTNAAFPNIGFGELSDYIETDLLTLPTTVTPVGNIGAPIFAQDAALFLNSSRTIMFGGTPAAPLFFSVNDTGRPIASFPSARITNMSVNSAVVDVYLLEAGTEISDQTFPLFANFPFPFSTGFFPPQTGALEITITAAGQQTPISAPLPIQFRNGEIVDIVILDTVDPAVTEVRIFASAPAGQ